MPHIDDSFKIFLEDLKDGKYSSPLQIPPTIWASHSWELLDRKKINELFLPLLSFQIDRAKKALPQIYKQQYDDKNISGNNINSIEEFCNIPLLIKN